MLAGATGAVRAEAWIRFGAQLRPVAVWPHDATRRPGPTRPGGGLPPFEAASRAVAVRHGDELLGALSLQKPRSEPLTTAEDKLLQHLASQAGLVLRNVALTAELGPRSTSCGPPAAGWSGRRTPNGGRSNATCTTGRSSSSSRCPSSSACWPTRPTTRLPSGR